MLLGAYISVIAGLIKHEVGDPRFHAMGHDAPLQSSDLRSLFHNLLKNYIHDMI